MRKKFYAVLASLLAVFMIAVATPSFASADQLTTVDSWNSVISTDKNGIVTVKNTVSPIPAGDSVDYALPVETSWDKVKGFSDAKSIKYSYRNFTVSEGYEIKVVTNAHWVILSVYPTSDAAEQPELTFSYDVHNAAFATDDAQQINVPLFPENFGSAITNYSVSMDSNSTPYENYCIRKEVKSTDCANADGDDADNVMYSGAYNVGDRIGIRATYPADTFTLKGHKSSSFEGIVKSSDSAEVKEVELPQSYVNEIESWNSTVNLEFTDDGKSSMLVNNTIVFDANQNKSDQLAFGFPLVLNNVQQNYSDFETVTEGYAIEANSDDIATNPDGIMAVVVKPEVVSGGNTTPDDESTPEETTAPETAVEPNLKTIEFSYKINNVVRQSTADNMGEGYIIALVKPSAPKVTVKEITADLASGQTVAGSESVCSYEDGAEYECENTNSGASYSAKGDINSEYYVSWGFEASALPSGIVAAPSFDGTGGEEVINPAPEEPAEPVDMSGFWGFLGNAFVFLLVVGALLLGVVMFLKALGNAQYRRRNGIKKTSYGVASGKPSYFIPSMADFKLPKKKGKDETAGTGMRPVGLDIFNLKPKFDMGFEQGGAGNVVQDMIFRPPRLDDGGEIKPYLYPFLSQKNEDSAMLTSALSIVGGLASKDAIRLVHDNNGRAGIQIQPDGMDKSLSPIEVVALQQLQDTTVAGRLPVLTPHMLKRITDDTRLGNMIKDEVKQLGFFNEETGIMNARNRASALVGSGAGVLGVGGAVAGGIALFAGAPLIALAGAGVAAASFLGMKKPLDNAIQDHRVRSVTGTGYLARMEAFRNYFKKANPDSRYSVERADVDAEYLPWALVFDLPEKWVDTFSAPTSTSGKNVLISGNSYPSNTLANSLRNVIKEIQTKTGQDQLLDKDRF